MKYILVLFLLVIAYSSGVIMGWDAGVRDRHALETGTVHVR
jgi:hypothetical protein